MTDGKFALRQLVEKRLEMQLGMAFGFVHQKKAYNTVPREMVMVTLRWMRVPEAEFRLVDCMYGETKGMMLVVQGCQMSSV